MGAVGRLSSRVRETSSRVESSCGYVLERLRLAVLLIIVALPLAYLAALIAAVLRRRFSEVAISLLCFGAALAAGAWSIAQSRSSTAGIGFLFLPVLASVSGALALAFTASRRSDSSPVRALGVLALLGAALLTAIELRGGRQTIAKNARRDADQAGRDTALARHRARLDTIIGSVGESRARDTLEALLRAHRSDRELVIAVLDRPQLSETMLDSLAHSPDLGIALHALQNPGTSSATLSNVYRTHSNRMYFFQVLAAHEHTPLDILREIHNLRPEPVTGLDIWFAGNPSSPPDVLLDLARKSESIDVVRRLLLRPSLDCGLLEAIARGPAARAYPDDADVVERITLARADRCP